MRRIFVMGPNTEKLKAFASNMFGVVCQHFPQKVVLTNERAEPQDPYHTYVLWDGDEKWMEFYLGLSGGGVTLIKDWP